MTLTGERRSELTRFFPESERLPMLDSAKRGAFAARRDELCARRYAFAMLVTRDTFARLCRARDLLVESSEHALSVREVADGVAISPFHFIRQFEALFGVTPHQFRIGVRVDRAKDLLARGELSVTAVCMEVGFSSLGSFSSMFARRVGVAPSLYRRKTRAFVQVPSRLVPAVPPGCFGLLVYGLGYASPAPAGL